MSRGDAPDDIAATVDLLASEYGWHIGYILSLPADVLPQLVHAMLWRKGVQTILRNPDKDDGALSLADKLKAITAAIDTDDEAET